MDRLTELKLKHIQMKEDIELEQKRLEEQLIEEAGKHGGKLPPLPRLKKRPKE